MHKIGVIGDRDSVLGFKAVGLEVFPVAGVQEGERVLRRLAEQQYAVVYVTEQLAADITKAIEEYNGRIFPAIIPVPGNRGALGIGVQGLKKTVERAVGADILFNK